MACEVDLCSARQRVSKLEGLSNLCSACEVDLYSVLAPVDLFESLLFVLACICACPLLWVRF